MLPSSKTPSPMPKSIFAWRWPKPSAADPTSRKWRPSRLSSRSTAPLRKYLPLTGRWRPALLQALADPRAWAALLYLLLSLGTGIAYFTWAVTGLSLSLGLLVLIVGLPLAILFLLSIRGIAFIEGRLVEALLGVRMPRRRMFFDDTTGFWKKIKNLFTQRITWTALAYCILQMGLGIAYFTVFAVLIGLSVYLLAMPITVLVLDMPAYIILGDTEYLATDWSVPIFFLLGVLLLPTTMHLAKLVGKGHGALAKFMLVSKQD
jgi:hypothetical protein